MPSRSRCAPPDGTVGFAVTAGVVGVAAVATAVVVAFTVTSPPGTTPAATSGTPARTASLVTEPVITGIAAPIVIQMVQALRPSLIAIGPVHGSNAAHMTGIVLAGGNLAVTSAAAVGRAKRVDIVTSSGQHRQVRVLGSDPHSGIAVVGTGGGLTPAPFADGDVQPGELAIAACLCGSATVAAAAAASAAVAEVRDAGTAVTLGSGTGLVDTIEADMPLGPAPLGGVLLNAQGQVVGVLDARKSHDPGSHGRVRARRSGRERRPDVGQVARGGPRVVGDQVHRRPRRRRGADHRRDGREPGRLRRPPAG